LSEDELYDVSIPGDKVEDELRFLHLALSLPHHSVTVTWHDDNLTHGKFFIFLKIQK